MYIIPAALLRVCQGSTVLYTVRKLGGTGTKDFYSTRTKESKGGHQTVLQERTEVSRPLLMHIKDAEPNSLFNRGRSVLPP